MVANAQGSFKPWLVFGGTISRSLELEPTLRQLTILRVAMLAGSDYERVWHEVISKLDGVPDDQIVAAVEGRIEDPAFDEREQLLLRFVTEAVELRGATEETTAAMQARFSSREIVEILLVVSHYFGLGILLNSTGVEPDPPLDAEAILAARAKRAKLA